MEGKPIDRANADEIVEIGELGFRLLPDRVDACIGWPSPECWTAQDARTLLVSVRADTPASGIRIWPCRSSAPRSTLRPAQANRLSRWPPTATRSNAPDPGDAEHLRLDHELPATGPVPSSRMTTRTPRMQLS